MASRRCRLVANALGRFGTPSARHYDLAARSIAARIGRKCPRWKHGPRPKIAMVERRKARVPPLRDAGAPRKRPDVQRYCTSTGCRCIRAPVGAPPTPQSGWKDLQIPGANASRKRIRLFDIVTSKIRNPEDAVADVAMHQALADEVAQRLRRPAAQAAVARAAIEPRHQILV